MGNQSNNEVMVERQDGRNVRGWHLATAKRVAHPKQRRGEQCVTAMV